jgi:hypothetical protein
MNCLRELKIKAERETVLGGMIFIILWMSPILLTPSALKIKREVNQNEEISSPGSY